MNEGAAWDKDVDHHLLGAGRVGKRQVLRYHVERWLHGLVGNLRNKLLHELDAVPGNSDDFAVGIADAQHEMSST